MQILNYEKMSILAFSYVISESVMSTVDKDLDMRYRWLGIKRMRKDYQPTPFQRRRKDGKHVGENDMAGVWG